MVVYVIWISYFAFASFIYWAGCKVIQSEKQKLKWSLGFSMIKSVLALGILIGLHFANVLPITKINGLIFLGFYFSHLVGTTLLSVRRRL